MSTSRCLVPIPNSTLLKWLYVNVTDDLQPFKLKASVPDQSQSLSVLGCAESQSYPLNTRTASTTLPCLGDSSLVTTSLVSLLILSPLSSPQPCTSSKLQTLFYVISCIMRHPLVRCSQLAACFRPQISSFKSKSFPSPPMNSPASITFNHFCF